MYRHTPAAPISSTMSWPSASRRSFEDVSACGQFPLHHEGVRVFFMADALDGQRQRLDEVHKDGADRQAFPVFDERHKHHRDIWVCLHLLQAIEPRQGIVQARASPVVRRCCLAMCARSEHPCLEGKTCDALDHHFRKPQSMARTVARALFVGQHDPLDKSRKSGL